MRSIPTVLPVYSVLTRKEKINPKPQYQRGAVWSIEKKQLLIDTTFRGYDIPKFYLRKVAGEYEHEVVDGQQRLRSIWEFSENEFPLGRESTDFDELPDLEGKYYSDLTSNQKDTFNAFSLSITELQDASELEIRELFLRLQEGSTLNPAEKRNAMIGNLRDFVKDLSRHPIFLKTGKRNERYLYDDWAAHITAIEIKGGPSDIKAADLKKLYESEVGFDQKSVKAKKIKRVLNYLDKAFPEVTPELGIKWGFVDLYVLVSSLIEGFDISEMHGGLFDFYLGFELERRNTNDPADLLSEPCSPWSRDLYDYIEAFQRSGGTRSNLQRRSEVYIRRFLSEFPELVPKDPNRAYTEDERVVIWRRASMQCQNPDCQRKLGLAQMHADHIMPHSKGGMTTIENGQSLCGPCNQQKAAKIET